MIKMYGGIAIILLFIAFVLVAAYFIPRFRARIVALKDKFYKKMVWNGLIRTATFAYINQCLYVMILLISDPEMTADTVGAICLNFYMLAAYPAFIAYITYKSRKLQDNAKLETMI